MRAVWSFGRSNPRLILVLAGLLAGSVLAASFHAPDAALWTWLAALTLATGDHGTVVSAQVADIVLQEDHVTRVAEARAIGQRLVRIAPRMAIAELGPSLALMTGAAFGVIPRITDARLQDAIDMPMILNAMRGWVGDARRPAWTHPR